MNGALAGKVAWVTGASSGLGHRFAQVLAAEGAVVALSARRAAAIQATAAEIERLLGPIDILVNNAGTSRQARLEDFTEADYDAVLDVDLKATFFAAQAAARQMIAHGREGRIVNIASVAAFRALGHQAPYSMAKAGLVALTRSQAREWGRHGINANAICPGYIRTEIGGAFWETEAGARLIAALPRKRMGEPRDLDALLLLLCSGEAARFINGAAMVADDGMMAW